MKQLAKGILVGSLATVAAIASGVLTFHKTVRCAGRCVSDNSGVMHSCKRRPAFPEDLPGAGRI